MSEKKKIKVDITEKLVKKFPEDAIKSVTFGRNYLSLDAYHVVARMNEVFGLCGIGWGFQGLTFNVHPNAISCQGEVWYVNPETESKGIVFAVGESAYTPEKKANNSIAECMKKAQTNLLSKATSYMGVGLNLYQGKGLDDPYLDREETSKQVSNDGYSYQYDLKEIPADKLPAVLKYLAGKEVYRSVDDESVYISKAKLAKLDKYQVIKIDDLARELNEVL